MGIIQTIKKILRSNISIKLDAGEAEINNFFNGPGRTLSGTAINEKTALNTTTVLACVRLYSALIGSLPCVLYQKKDGRRITAEGHPLYRVLKIAANDEIPSMNFFETSQVHQELWGNAYAQILRTNGGKVYGLQPLQPAITTVQRAADRRLIYKTQDIDGKQVELDASEILHVAGMGFDGLVGKSPVGLMREAIGLAVASEEFGARFFGNGANPSGYLEHPSQLSKEAAARLRDTFEASYSGLNNAHRVAVLEEGMKYNKMTMPLKDSQFLEGRAFQQTEIASAFQVPPVLIGLQEKTSSWGTGIEQIMVGFLIFSMQPRLIRIEQAMTRKLLTEKEQKEFYIKFNVRALMRGDAKSRYEVYQVARQNGIMSSNEIRELEDMDPVEDGDVYWRPANMVDASEPAATAPATPEPAPAAAPADTTPAQSAGKK